ncbi:MAG TPA: LysR family transcriptional regulator [Syntrophorhabdales bacterium]|nr:LysR family transcriptional regulator [Syntrophorhabdales bacterium]
MKNHHINLEQLVTFYFVAKERSLSGASAKLFVTAPAVTMQVKALENHFGVKLITIRKKKIYLTNAGNALLPSAESVYRSAMKAEALLLNYKNNLRLGVATALTRLFTPAISKFKALHPSVGLTLTEGRSLLLIEGLLDFQHDMCIVAAPPEISDQLASLRLSLPEKLVLISAPGTPLGEKTEVSWCDLTGYPIVLHGEGSLSRRLVLQEFQKRNVSPLIAASVESEEGMRQLVQQKVGASFIVACNVEQDVALGKLKIIPIKEGGIELFIDIIYHKGQDLPPVATDFLSLVTTDFDATRK